MITVEQLKEECKNLRIPIDRRGYVSEPKAAKLIGICYATLRRWRREKRSAVQSATRGARQRYSLEMIAHYLNESEHS